MDFTKATPEQLKEYVSKAGDGYVQLSELVRGLSDLRAAVLDESARLSRLRADVEQIIGQWTQMQGDIAAVAAFRAALKKES